jgi:RNA polymerase sigma-70 factor (ECF subfamily)
MVHFTDNDLIRHAQQGDMDAFRKLVERYQSKTLWIAYQMVGNYEEARDISQEVFIRVYRSLAKFNLSSNFYTWLYRIIINLCIDYLRRQKHNSKAISLEDVGEVKGTDINAEQYLERKELSQEANAVLNQLPVQYRLIIILRDIEGFSCKEIEQIVGCNHNTVRWRLFRARQIFKETWEKEQQLKEQKRLQSHTDRKSKSSDKK